MQAVKRQLVAVTGQKDACVAQLAESWWQFKQLKVQLCLERLIGILQPVAKGTMAF